MPPSLRLRFE